MKKLISVLLALILVLSLAACGGSSTKTPETLGEEPAVTPGTAETPSDSDTAEEPEGPGVWEGDYETATIQDVIQYGVGSTRWDGALPLVTDGYQLEIGLKTDYRVTDLDDNPLTHWVKEQTGIDLTFNIFAGSSADIATQLSLMISGGEPLSDIIRVNGFSEEIKSEYVRYGDLVNMAGYFMTDAYYFSEALRENYPDQNQYERIRNFALYRSSDAESGYMYAFPVIYNQSSATVNTQIMINQNWLNKLGLQKPTTPDELYNVLVAFRDRDPNGNGKKDEIPMIGLTNSIGRGVDNYIVNSFIQWSVTNRIQVENGVSAAIARVKGQRVDLIAEQIRLALGEPMNYSQDDITFEGVGVEYRIIAENPAIGFTPWVGDITAFSWQDAPYLSVHTHVPPVTPDTPYSIPTEFDPNLALGIVWGKNLAEVQANGLAFLDSLTLDGQDAHGDSLKSNVEFLRANTARILQF